MNTLLILILAALLFVTVAGMVWRFATRRYALPCPPWLDFFLENPIALSEAEKQIARAELKPGMNVLDVGCGTGRLTIPAAKRVGADGGVVALDLQQEMLQKVELRARENGLMNVQFMLVGVGQGAFQEQDAYDCAFLTTVLGEIVDQRRALQEIYRALKSGGILSITEVMVDPHYQSRKTVLRLARNAGFELFREFGNALSFTMNFMKRKTDEN